VKRDGFLFVKWDLCVRIGMYSFVSGCKVGYYKILSKKGHGIRHRHTPISVGVCQYLSGCVNICRGVSISVGVCLCLMPSPFFCLSMKRDIVLIVCEIACFPFVKWDVCACSGMLFACVCVKRAVCWGVYV